MYRLMRSLHLGLGQFFLFFLLMYGASAVQMAHPAWFPMEPAVTEERLAVDPALAGSAPALAHLLREEHGLRGDLQRVDETPGGLSLRIVRPGTVHDVEYDRAAGAAQVRTSVATFMGMLNRIHHVGGLWHEYALINVWGLLVGLVSVGLVLLALSGIYLWFRIHRERRAGALVLGASLAVSLTLMVLIRLA